MSTKILLNTLTSGCDCRTYTTPKGNDYTFSMGLYTEVKDSEDALHFLNAGNGTVFQVEKGPVKKAIDALKKLIKEEKVDEEKAPEESGILDVDPEAPIDGDEGIDALGDETPETEGDKVPEADADFDPEPEAPEEVVEKQIFTAEGLKDLNAKQQTFLIKGVSGKEANIPRYEKDKIELLIKLQNEGANLVELLKGYVA